MHNKGRQCASFGRLIRAPQALLTGPSWHNQAGRKGSQGIALMTAVGQVADVELLWADEACFRMT